MKMSDVLDLPLRVDGVSLADKDGIQVSEWGFEGDTLNAAAVNAINSHDALVELSKELVDVLQHANLGFSALLEQGSCGDMFTAVALTQDRIVLTLNKAKELLKEQG